VGYISRYIKCNNRIILIVSLKVNRVVTFITIKD
jgi:hypothetical protein